MSYPCPSCGAETRYAAFSGGREWQCPSCDNCGYYPEDAEPIRAHLLRTEEGRVTLRAEMDTIVVVSACPQDIVPINDCDPTSIAIELLESE